MQIGRNVFDGTVQRAVWEALGIDTSKLSVITLYRFRCGSRVRACMRVGIESSYRPTNLPVHHGLGLLRQMGLTGGRCRSLFNTHLQPVYERVAKDAAFAKAPKADPDMPESPDPKAAARLSRTL